MKCLRCGYCCINYDVIIVDNADVGPIKGNLKHKPTGKKCQHLKRNEHGGYFCMLHDYPWYKETPCFAHSQIERGNTECRMGAYILNKEQEAVNG